MPEPYGSTNDSTVTRLPQRRGISSAGYSTGFSSDDVSRINDRIRQRGNGGLVSSAALENINRGLSDSVIRQSVINGVPTFENVPASAGTSQSPELSGVAATTPTGPQTTPSAPRPDPEPVSAFNRTPAGLQQASGSTPLNPESGINISPRGVPFDLDNSRRRLTDTSAQEIINEPGYSQGLRALFGRLGFEPFGFTDL